MLVYRKSTTSQFALIQMSIQSIIVTLMPNEQLIIAQIDLHYLKLHIYIYIYIYIYLI